MTPKLRTRASSKWWPACAVLALFAFGSSANATVTRINFDGAAGSGYADLTLQPVGSNNVVNSAHVPQEITDARGTFGGAAITGVLAPNHAPPPPGEVLPYNYSLFEIPGLNAHGGVSYDNLFYPTGSPLICYINGDLFWDYAGGFVDLMGVMFTLDNGNFVDLWSFGNTAPGTFGPNGPSGLVYGMQVIHPIGDGQYEVLPGPPFATASVPEPNFLWLLGASLIGLFAWRRRLEATRRG